MKIVDNKESLNLNPLISQWTIYFYFHNSGNSLYSLLIKSIEPALLKTVLEASRYNKARAARILGISPCLLRKKLIEHFGDKYIENY